MHRNKYLFLTRLEYINDLENTEVHVPSGFEYTSTSPSTMHLLHTPSFFFLIHNYAIKL